MMNLFTEFNKVTKKEWTDKLLKDLKGQPEELLHVNDEIEGISYDSYYHNEDSINRNSPGNLPYTRGVNKALNNWDNCTFINIQDEKKANAKALNALMNGSDMLWLKHTKDTLNWSDVLSDIQTEYINIVIETNQIEDIILLHKSGKKNISFAFDLFDQNGVDLNRLTELYLEEQSPFLLIDAMKLQEAGANISQQISFALNLGHEYLLELMKNEMSIDEASACIQFRFGVGSSYFNESIKFRVFRELWSNIVAQYNPEHRCSHNARIHAFTTHVNKSLKDPYTNLLRQTTEAMSAINGDVESLCVLPYDIYSVSGESELASRMARNISNILKEESYFDKVCDVLGGSYSIENVQEKIVKESWKRFQSLESLGGLFNEEAKENLFDEVNETAKKRVEMLSSGKNILIGVNKYENPDAVDNSWMIPNNYNGLTTMILEKELENSMA